MKKDINIIELFSGIGGFTLGFQKAGYKIKNHYFSEIDKHAIANYKYNFQNAQYIGDVKSIQRKRLKSIDIITFGSPCQDFSLAGKREGLEGKRSSLIQYAIDLISDTRPSVFIWENVKGAFSSNHGADFWAILQAFANIGGYRLEWQLLNTKWFLPQNRERIYLIGHLDGRSEPGVFPIEKNDRIFNEKKGTNKIGVQTKHSTTIKASGNVRPDDTFIEVPKIASCLTAGGNSGGLHSDMTTVEVGAIRGRNPENPKSRESGLKTEQMLEVNQNGTSNTLTSVTKDNVVISSFTRDEKGKVVNRNEREICNTITSATGSGGSTDVYVNNIRRLTEIECERLQGFPDDWTKFGNYDGNVKEIPKTQRYKMCGNAVTVDVVEEIAKRLTIK